jgi:hypothetical protein
MKQIFVGVLLGISLILNVASGDNYVTNKFFTVRPEKPFSTICFKSIKADERIVEYSKVGYIVKCISYASNGNALVVMEKY